MLSAEEAIWFYPLMILNLLVLGSNLMSKDRFNLWSPLSVVSLIYLYYTVVGPIFSIMADETYYRLIDHRPYFAVSWKAAFWSYFTMVISFNLFKNRKLSPFKLQKSISSTEGEKLLLWIAVLGSIASFGLSGFSALAGGSLQNNLGGGGLSNYVLYTVNVFVVVLNITFLQYLINKRQFGLFLFLLIYVMALYLALGFRYRLVLVFGSLMMTYFITTNKKPNFILLTVFLIVFVGLMGFIQMTRNYHHGLVITESVANASYSDFIITGLAESSVFQSTGIMLATIPEQIPHQGFQFIIETITMPIPRSLWAGKPSGESIEVIHQVYEYYTGIDDLGLGAAIMNYAEAYVAFGWSGLVVISFIWGYLFSKLWNFIRINRNNYLSIILFTVCNSFIYVVLSRGYLPQVAYMFFFTVYPIMWLRSKYLKSSKNRKKTVLNQSSQYADHQPR